MVRVGEFNEYSDSLDENSTRPGYALNRADQKTIMLFINHKEGSSIKLDSTGDRLDIFGLGGRGVAEWIDGKIVFNDLGSRFAQTIQRAIKRRAPAYDLAEDIQEARKEGFTYTEKEVKGAIDRVTLELQAQDASAFSKLSNRFAKVKTLIDELTVEQKALNAKIKLKVDDLFDATDIVYTRVVETVKLTATMSKQSTEPDTQFDKVGYTAELEDMIPELESKLKKLKEKYTTVKSVQRSPKLTIKVKKQIKEDLDTFFDKLKTFAASIKEQVSNWANTYDQKLEDLRSHLPVTETLGGQAVGFGRIGRNPGSRKQDLLIHIKMTQSALGQSMEMIRSNAPLLSKKSVEDLEKIFKDLRAELEFVKSNIDEDSKDYDMKAIGAEAFRNGQQRVPALDPRLMAAIANMEVGGSHEYLKDWLAGWDRENLKD